MKYVLLILLFLTPLAYSAEIYTETDQSGSTTYSDTPMGNGAKRIEAPEVNVSSSQSDENDSSEAAPQKTPATTDNTDALKIRKPYATFFINSPADQATIQNQPVIAVDISLDPSLQDGDKIQVYLDGAPWGKSLPSTHFEFTAPFRGAHQFSAKLIDANQHVLKETGSNTVYIHQAALGGPGIR